MSYGTLAGIIYRGVGHETERSSDYNNLIGAEEFLGASSLCAVFKPNRALSSPPRGMVPDRGSFCQAILNHKKSRLMGKPSGLVTDSLNGRKMNNQAIYPTYL